MHNTGNWICASLILTASVDQTAWAQKAAEDSGAAGGTLEEIVITAERRSENIMTVPIAITAINGDQLGDKAVSQLADLQFAAPGLTISNSGLTQSVNIRGIGLASGSPAVANGVASYFDGLFQVPIVGTGTFYDIANVEVLRGPQGTLVGSNSTGGAIFINSQSPKLNETSGYAAVDVGNYGTHSVQGAINLPAGDAWAFRAAGNYSKHDSFYDSIGTAHTDAGELDEKSARFGMLWNPGALQALAKFEYTDRNTGGYAYRPIPGTPYYSTAQPDFFTLSYNSPTKNHERKMLSEVELRYELANGVTLRSLTGYQDMSIHNLYDVDAASTSASTTDQHIRERIWTEEINIISPTDGPYNWILGAYGQKNKIDVHLLNDAALFPIDIVNPQNKTTTGWFGQINFHLTPRLELQTGVRYSTFKVDGVGHVIIGYGLPGFGNIPGGGLQVANLTGGHQDGRTTGKVALNFQMDDNNLLYAFASRGYKPGGFNSATSEFNPETVWDYEAGWKSTLLDNHFRTQLGVFYNKYDNFQFGLLDPSSGRVGVSNLPSATIQGFEGQVQAQVGSWKFDGGVAYVDSKLNGVGSVVNTLLLPPPGAGNLGPQCATGQTTGCFDYAPYTQAVGSGPNLYSPEWTYNVGAEYEIAFANDIRLTPRLNYAYLSSQYMALTYSSTTDLLAARGLWSALLTLQIHDSWSVQAYGTNLTNKTYLTGVNNNNEFIGAPRQFGLRFSTKF